MGRAPPIVEPQGEERLALLRLYALGGGEKWPLQEGWSQAFALTPPALSSPPIAASLVRLYSGAASEGLNSGKRGSSGSHSSISRHLELPVASPVTAYASQPAVGRSNSVQDVGVKRGSSVDGNSKNPFKVDDAAPSKNPFAVLDDRAAAAVSRENSISKNPFATGADSTSTSTTRTSLSEKNSKNPFATSPLSGGRGSASTPSATLVNGTSSPRVAKIMPTATSQRVPLQHARSSGSDYARSSSAQQSSSRYQTGNGSFKNSKYAAAGTARQAAGRPWSGIKLDRNCHVIEMKLGKIGIVESASITSDTPANDNMYEGGVLGCLAYLPHIRLIQLDGNRITSSITPITRVRNVQWLTLSGCRLSGHLPPSIGYMRALVQLDLAGNLFSGSIPSEIGALGSLQSLSLAHNAFTGSLPTSLSNLGACTYMDVSNNQLSGPIPKEIGCMKSLRDLRLDHNRLSGRVPRELANLTSLRTLLINNNLLEGALPDKLVKQLGQKRVLAHMFAGNRFSDMTTAMVVHTQTLTCTSDRALLCFSICMGYIDLGSDVATVLSFFNSSKYIAVCLGIIFIELPALVSAWGVMYADSPRKDYHRCIYALIHILPFIEACESLKEGRETVSFKTAKFVAACLETAPQLLLTSSVMAIGWADGQNIPLIVAVSAGVSVLSLAWELTAILDRGYVDEASKERKTIYKMKLLFYVWVYHVCEVGARGVVLGLATLTLRWWMIVAFFVSWMARFTIAKYHDSGLNASKALVKGIVAVLLDSVFSCEDPHTVALLLSLLEAGGTIAIVQLGLPYTLPGRLQPHRWQITAAVGIAWAFRLVLACSVRNTLLWGGRKQAIREANRAGERENSVVAQA